MMKRLFPILLLTILFLGAALIAFRATNEPETLRGFEVNPPFPAENFTLTHASGDPVSLQDFENKVVLLYFGYTFCPDVCPSTLLDLKQVLNSLGDEASEVQVIMITVDPERDTPEVVAEYVQAFSPSFIGLSGTAAEISAVAEKYGIFYEAHEGTAATGYLIDHTASVILIDKAGNYRATYPFGMTRDDFSHDLSILITEG